MSSKGNPEFLALLEELKSLHLAKTQDYGSQEDPLYNLRRASEIGILPAVGSWLRAKDKVGRIDLFFRRGNLVNEGVEDSLKDLAAYCLLTLVLMKEQNQKEREVRIQGYDGKPCPFCGGLRTICSDGLWICEDCGGRGSLPLREDEKSSL